MRKANDSGQKRLISSLPELIRQLLIALRENTSQSEKSKPEPPKTPDIEFTRTYQRNSDGIPTISIFWPNYKSKDSEN